MSKYFKIIAVFIFLVVGLFSFSVNAESIPSSLTLSSVTDADDRAEGYEALFKMGNGKYAYCLTPEVFHAPVGTVHYNTGTYNNGSVLYILDNYQVNNNRSFLIAQLAIWQVYNNASSKYHVSNIAKYKGTSLETESIALANKAKANSNYKGKSVAIALNNGTDQLKLTSDDKFYESSLIKVTLTNSNSYNVSVSGINGAYIVSATNIKKNTFNNLESFKVVVPKENVKSITNLNVTISANGVRSVVKQFDPKDGKSQVLGVLFQETVTTSVNKKLTVTPVLNICKIINNKYYDKFGKETTESIYKEQCLNICKIVNNKYFDKDGKETTESIYKEQCLPKCEIKDGKYYDKSGNVVNEAEFNNQCRALVVPVPDTSTSAFVSLILGLLIMSGGFGAVVVNKKLRK